MEEIKISFKKRSAFDIFSSLASKTILSGMVFYTGYFDVTPIWICSILIGLAYRNHKRLESVFNQQVSTGIFYKMGRKMVLINANPFPKSVNFPEEGNCEFLNKITQNMWSKMSKYTENLLKQIIEPKINESLKKYKNGPEFKFHTIRLGSICPRLYGLNVKKKCSRQMEYIIFDVMVFYAGDTELYYYLMSFGGGVQNLEISGHIRIVLTVLKLPIPMIKRVEIFFVHKPKLDYDFTGAMDILSVPGVSGMLRRTIDDQLSSNVVLPNKITVGTIDIVNSSCCKCLDPEGLLRIKIIKASGLGDSGSGVFSSGFAETYITVTFGPQTFTSQTVNSFLDPEWNFCANLIVDYLSFDDKITIVVSGKNGSTILGKVTLDLNLTVEKKHLCSWVQLEDSTSGMIYLEIFYYNLTCQYQVEQQMEQPCVLVVFVRAAFNLEIPNSSGNPDSAVYLRIDNDTKSSKSVSSKNPIFNEEHIFVIENEAKDKTLKLKLVDQKSNYCLGNANIPLKRVFEAKFLEVIDLMCPLIGAVTESSLQLSIRIRIATVT